MSKRNDLKAIEAEKAHLLTTLCKLDPEYDDYKRALDAYNTLVQTEQAIRSGSNERSNNWIGTVMKGLGIAGSVFVGVFVPLTLADKAYDEEKQFKLKNGTIWNLIGKKFDPKT